MTGILIVPALDENGESNWPERWSTERLLSKKAEIGTIPFSSQFMLDPVDMNSNFLKADWLQYYLDDQLPPLVNFIGVDPSPSGRPGTDYFALAVLGVDEGHNGYLRSAYRLQIDPMAQVERIRSEAAVYQPAQIQVEAVAAQALFTRYMLQDEENPLPVKESTTRFPKEIRYLKIAPLFETGRIKVRGQMVDGELGPHDSVSDFFKEWASFHPEGKRDDTLDAVEKAIEGARLVSGNPLLMAAVPGKKREGGQAPSVAIAGGGASRRLRGSGMPGRLRPSRRRTLGRH